MIFWFYFETEDSPAQFAADSAGAHTVEMTLDRGTALPLLWIHYMCKYPQIHTDASANYTKSLKATCNHFYGHNLRRKMPITLHTLKG